MKSETHIKRSDISLSVINLAQGLIAHGNKREMFLRTTTPRSSKNQQLQFAMSLTLRKPTAETTALGDGDDISKDVKDVDSNGKDRPVQATRKLSTRVLLGMFVALAILPYFLSKLAWLRCVTLSPVIFCLWLVVEPNKDQSLSQRILPLSVVVTTVSAQLPNWLGAAFAALGILAFGLTTIPASETSNVSLKNPASPESALPVVTAVILMIAVLLLDNFFVWVVAATFKPGHHVATSPGALQDNGQLVFQWLLSDLTRREVVSLRRLWNVQNALIACLGASFVSLEVFREQRRTLYRISRRAVLTLAAARFIRVVSFTLTVLPSQSKRCYVQKFPVPPPEDWIEWILVGFRPYSHGGCNDLIISGHATVVSVLACISGSVGTDALFQACLWSLVVLDFCVEIYEGFHYSVDMFLGAVLVCLLWRVLASTEDAGPISYTPRQQLRELSTTKIGLYCLPVLGAYAQLTILPRAITIPVIVLYATVAVGFLTVSLRSRAVPLRQAAYQHAAQHTLLSLLFFALGVYL